jgi:hypothetical protein
LVLKKNDSYPKAVFLFEEKQLEAVMKRNEGETEYDYIKALYSPESQKSKDIFKLIWKPIDELLRDINNVYLSPAGILNKIAFDAIPYDADKLLSDKFNLIYTTSTAQITGGLGMYREDIKSSVLFGGIIYDMSPEEMKRILNKSSSGTNAKENYAYYAKEMSADGKLEGITRGFSWNYLPGSLAETEQIENLLRSNNINVSLYKGKDGTEEQFKALEKEAPSVIHISTHGFYFNINKKEFDYETLEADVEFARLEDPLYRSGFILAGGNTSFRGDDIPPGSEDGVLTALEISRLNFFDTELVVLSACQTGLGDVKGSEGVYGLQRAFKMAGVDYLIFSLWKVPDEATKELMTKFYDFWFAGAEIRTAFKNAQEHLKEKYKDIPGSAYAWAAFVLIK